MFHTFPGTNNNKANRVTDQTATLIDHILTNSPDKVSQSGVIDLGLSDHDLIYCTRKTSLPKSHKHNEIFVRSLKRYSAEKFLEILREIVFPNYLTYTCVNDAYSDFIYRFVEAINFIAPSKKIRVKANSKPWFLITKLCQQCKDGINSIKSSNILVYKLIRTILKPLKSSFRKWYWRKRNLTLKKN